ncbi:MAG: hypothetical protein AAF399_21145 [Bacteroidota bacterium]
MPTPHWLVSGWIDLWPWDTPIYLRIEYLNGLAGIALLSVVYAWIRRNWRTTRRLARHATFLLGASYGIWAYSTLVEVYLLPLFALMMSLWCLTPRQPRLKHVLGTPFWLAIAIVLHQSHILFLPVLLLGWYWQGKRGYGIWQRVVGVNIGILALLVGGSYLAVMLGPMELRSAGEMLHWLIGYGHDGGYWATISWRWPLEPLVGFGRSLIGGQWLYALPGMERLTGGFHLSDEAFLVRSLSQGDVFLLLGLTGILILILSYHLMGLRTRYRMASDHQRMLYRLLGAGFLSYSLFFLFWVPINPEFWLPQLLFFWLILARTGPWPHRRYAYFRKRWFMIPLLCLLWINDMGSMRHLRYWENDLYYLQTQELAMSAGPNDLIILPQRWIQAEYVRKYSGAEVLIWDEWRGKYESDSLAITTFQARLNQAMDAYQQVVIAPGVIPAETTPGWWSIYVDQWQKIPRPSGTQYVLVK